MANIVAVVLAYNEAIHLDRCLTRLRPWVREIVVVDSFSSDATVSIAEGHGATVLRNRWTNHSRQFNWALSNLRGDAEWVLRIDADEYLSDESVLEIQNRLGSCPAEICGINFDRTVIFQAKKINFGGFRHKTLRLFRRGLGRCETRWMDEHIVVSGDTLDFSGELLDHNLNTLTWWIQKHNQYACREAVDLLNLRYGFLPQDCADAIKGAKQAAAKRWLKERVYSHLPGGIRAGIYFLYRYFVRLGFLDGGRGFVFHFLQGYWYRLVVDLKVSEVIRHMGDTGVDIRSAVRTILGVDLAPAELE